MLNQLVSYFLPARTYSPQFSKGIPQWMYPLYLKKIYKFIMKKRLNLNNPKSFSEKIQYLKLYDNQSIKTLLSDKLACRDWVKERVPGIKFAEVYQVWDTFLDIDFRNCPKSFILKTNHASKSFVKIKDKEEFLSRPRAMSKAARLIENFLAISYDTVSAFELQYKGIQPKVFAEECLGDPEIEWLSDYKILCFNGKPKFIEVFMPINKDVAEMYVMDTNWNMQEFYHSANKYSGPPPKKPKNLDKMLEYAKALSKDFKFVRVDFFDVEDEIYFCEMTFTPCSGFMKFHPEKYDEILGNMLVLK